MSECDPTALAQLAESEPSLKLLIVEDSHLDAELVAITLEGAGIVFSYDLADTVSLCQQYLQQNSYSAVLSDYRLAGFTAYQTLELLRQSGQDIPFILVTGTLGEEAAVECIKAGMTDYVLKDRLFRLPTSLMRSLQEFELRRQQQAANIRLRQQAQREALIYQIVRAMRETLVLDEVMQITVDRLHETLQVDRCLIFTPKPNSEVQVRQVSQATVDREQWLSKHLSAEVHPFYTALAQSEPVIISNVDARLPPDLQAAAKVMTFRAVMVMPLLYQVDYLGGIGLHQCDRDREWTADEIALVRAIADQCAIAVHQAQLFNQMQHQAQREQLLNQISRTLNSSLDPDYILQEIVRLTGESFDVDRVTIFAADAEHLKVLTEWRANVQIASLAEAIFSLNHTSETLETDACPLWLHQILHASDSQSLYQAYRSADSTSEAEADSSVWVPIVIREQLFGGIVLATVSDRRTFTDDEVQFLQQISEQTAIALSNAQSYEYLEQLVQKRTHELEREKQLSESANRTKTEFLTHMSHELRTPLTGVLGFSNLLLKEVFGPLNAKQQQYVEGIASCGKHLLELINDLLDLSKIEAGKEELFFETVVIQEVCEACMGMIFEAANNRGLELSLTIEPNVSVCQADKRRLKQILFNLLSNAVKFTEVGSVQLKVNQTKDNIIHFDVIDTGIGISESDQSKLFQSFQQLDSGLNRKYEGTGLGLVLARKLAQLHNGDITVISTLGQGSCFSLHLPVSDVQH